jgi:hypothetical protein
MLEPHQNDAPLAPAPTLYPQAYILKKLYIFDAAPAGAPEPAPEIK